jgi:hypothetical protein
MMDYERLFRTGPIRVPLATYVFTDMDRLAPWELRRAAQLYRNMSAAGLRCLNDPSRAMSRVELLTTLNAKGINPFSVMRADVDPKPSRFPVFLRGEDNHQQPSDELFHDQAELEQALRDRRNLGIPPRGLLVVEQAAEPYREGLWAKWATWRIGDRTIGEHLLIHDSWLVKDGDYRNMTAQDIEAEHEAASTDRFAADIEPVFKIAGIEFGRADHSIVDGRTVIYEINTNPFISRWEADPRPLREATQRLIRTRIADALAAIDTSETGAVEFSGLTSAARP